MIVWHYYFVIKSHPQFYHAKVITMLGDIFGSQNKLIRLGYFCAPPGKKAIMFLLMPIFCIFLNLIFLQSIWWMHCKRREMIGKFTLDSFEKTLIKDKLAAEDIQIKSDKCANFK